MKDIVKTVFQKSEKFYSFHCYSKKFGQNKSKREWMMRAVVIKKWCFLQKKNIKKKKWIKHSLWLFSFYILMRFLPPTVFCSTEIEKVVFLRKLYSTDVPVFCLVISCLGSRSSSLCKTKNRERKGNRKRVDMKEKEEKEKRKFVDIIEIERKRKKRQIL